MQSRVCETIEHLSIPSINSSSCGFVHPAANVGAVMLTNEGRGWSYTHTHPFNGPLSGTTRVSRYQKGKTNLDFTEARDNEWQWHQLGHMQVCTALQTDSQAGCPSCHPTNSVKALKEIRLNSDLLLLCGYSRLGVRTDWVYVQVVLLCLLQYLKLKAGTFAMVWCILCFGHCRHVTVSIHRHRQLQCSHMPLIRSCSQWLLWVGLYQILTSYSLQLPVVGRIVPLYLAE